VKVGADIDETQHLGVNPRPFFLSPSLTFLFTFCREVTVKVGADIGPYVPSILQHLILIVSRPTHEVSKVSPIYIYINTYILI